MLGPRSRTRNSNVRMIFISFFLVFFFLFRVPEIVYQPSLLGIEQAGISETIDFILNHYSTDLQTALVQVGYGRICFCD